MNQVTLLDIKQAMRDHRFREKLPAKFEKDIEEYLKDPNCKCNSDLYLKIIRECKSQIQEYFPGKKIIDPDQEIETSWKVINCHIDELESELRKLSFRPKQLQVARYQDQITVVMREI